MIKKAGTILLNKDTKQIGLVYRKKHNDLSFPKGHVKENESLIECAVRETIEETGRKCKIIDSKPIYINKYLSKEGEVENYMFLAFDEGKFLNNTDEELVWIHVDNIKKNLKYNELIKMWDDIYPIIKNYFK